MSTITLHYTLTEDAQRAELAAGRDAHRGRELQLTPTDWLASIASLAPDGSAEIRMVYTAIASFEGVKHEADHVLAEDEAEAWIREQISLVETERVKAREAKVKQDQENERIRAKQARKEAERKVEYERLAAEREAKLVPFREACKHCVVDNVPEYRRAAEDGHDVTRIAKATVTDELREQCSKVGELIVSYQTRERECPKALAYAMLDKAKKGLQLRDCYNNILTSIESGIVRADVAPHGDAVWRTAIKVTITFADDTTSELYVLADEEPMPVVADEDEDED